MGSGSEKFDVVMSLNLTSEIKYDHSILTAETIKIRSERESLIIWASLLTKLVLQ